MHRGVSVLSGPGDLLGLHPFTLCGNQISKYGINGYGEIDFEGKLSNFSVVNTESEVFIQNICFALLTPRLTL